LGDLELSSKNGSLSEPVSDDHRRTQGDNTWWKEIAVAFHRFVHPTSNAETKRTDAVTGKLKP
jgi:hypothetical protein